MKENFGSKEYRDNLAKDLKDIRKDNPEKALDVLETIKTTSNFQEAEKYNSEERIERRESNAFSTRENKIIEKIRDFKNGEFNVYVPEQIDNKNLDELKEAGFSVEDKVFVSIASNTDNFELLKAIDNEFKKGNKDFKIFIMNEFVNWDWFGKRNVLALGVPFEGMLPFIKDRGEHEANWGGYGTVEDVLNDLQEGKSDKVYYSDESLYLKEVRDNQCDLLNEWAQYYQSHFNETGYKLENYSTYSSGNDLTIEHTTSKSDSKKIQEIFKDFLKEKGVELELTNSKIGGYSEYRGVDNEFMNHQKSVPIATKEYHILINKIKASYSERSISFHDRDGRYDDVLKNGYAISVAKEIMARPESIEDERYAFGKDYLEKNQRRG